MPDVLRTVMSVLVDALAAVGATVLIACGVALFRKHRKRPQSDSHVVLHQALRQTIDDDAAKQQEAITDAVSADDAADELAELGNQRRG